MSDRIVAVTILLDDRIWQLPKPNRHHHVIKMIVEELPFPDDEGDMPDLSVQGFVTDRGRFVDRVEGLKIAQAAKQIHTRERFRARELFSEDLW